MSRHGIDFRWKPRDRCHVSKSLTWKDRYRERCMERLKDSRFKKLLTKRQGQPEDSSSELSKDKDLGATNSLSGINRKDELMKDVHILMSNEWKQMQKEDALRKGLEPNDTPAPSVDEMIELMEEILEELRMEQQYFSKRDEVTQELACQEDEELCLAFHRLSAVEVICPLCQKECLEEAPSCIFCKCGLNINTEQDSISLKNVSDSLEVGTTDHELQCDKQPSFYQMSNFGISNLVMTCENCDFHFIVV